MYESRSSLVIDFFKIRRLESVHDEAGNSRTRLSWYPSPANRPFECKAVGASYYPVCGLNELRPGLITHYRGGDWSDRFVSFTEAGHGRLVLDAIVSLYREKPQGLYTGDYTRICWLEDEHTAITSWCRPDVKQHKL